MSERGALAHRIAVALVLLAILPARPSSAQSDEHGLITLDVSSVKGYDHQLGYRSSACYPGTITTGGLPVQNLITWAYSIPPQMVINARLPTWTQGLEYDIQAKAEGVSDCRLIVRALLQERFKFVYHWRKKETSIYYLVVAKGGHKLQPVTETDKGPGFSITVNGKPMQDLSSDIPKGKTMTELATLLSRFNPEHLQVLDKTSLEGQFKGRLAFSGVSAEFSDPELEAALIQQLGLKLEAHKELSDYFVIDKIERPEPN